MMFQLGGMGQGAKRPCYSRQTRDRAFFSKPYLLDVSSARSICCP